MNGYISWLSSALWARTFFVSITTLFYAFSLVFALYLWSTNRQTQIRPSKSQRCQKATVANVNSVHGKNEERYEIIPHHEDLEEDLTRALNAVSPETHHAHEICASAPAAETTETLRCTLKKISVLSYLCEADFENVVQAAEFVDLDCGGTTDVNETLYVVLAGSVSCRCYETSNEFKPHSFIVNPGEVVTSRLAIILGITKVFLKQNCGEIIESEVNSYDDDSESHIKVKIEALSDRTRLVRLPPRTFLQLIECNSTDMHRIAQSILSRFQRVTMHTLVKRLGFDRHIFLNVADKYRIKPSQPPSLLGYQGFSAKPDMESPLASLCSSLCSQLAMYSAAALGSRRTETVCMIADTSSIVTFQPRRSLFEVGERVQYVYIVLSGVIDIGTIVTADNYCVGRLSSDSVPNQTAYKQTEEPPSKTSYHFMYSLGSGDVVGHLEAFTGEISAISARAAEHSMLLKVPKRSYDVILSTDPRSLAKTLWYILHDFISPVAHLLDWGIDWLHLRAGDKLVAEGQPCTCFYMVMAGRLRSEITTSKNKFNRSGYKDFGKGTCLGDIEILTGATWPGDTYAVRNSELAVIPDFILEFIFTRFPASGFHFAKVIARQVQSFYSGESFEGKASEVASGIRREIMTTVATIAVVPLSFSYNEDEAGTFCNILAERFDEIAPTALISKRMVGSIIESTQPHLQHTKITQLLGEMEENYRFLIFQADQNLTWWTKQCIRQADCVLLLTNAEHAHIVQELEDYLEHYYKNLNVRIELVILCKQEDRERPLTVCDEINRWSDKRPWPSRQHMVRLPCDENINDLKRLCRRVSGFSVGLVLGGGGARGLAHLGVIKALIEAGINVDVVGGCSQGALIGSIYSQHPDPCDFNVVLKISRRMAKMMSNVTDKLLDLTFPVVSYFNGASFNRSVSNILGPSTRIENLLLNFFCVSVDVCNNMQVIHTKGLCWKYVRASMSLHSYLPPISENGSLLLDGGYVNILPIDVMAESMGARVIIAVDVSGEDSNGYYEYGTQLSGWWLLWNSWNPFVKTVKVPSMGELSQKLIWVSSNRHLKEVSKEADLLLVPPVHNYGTLDYDKFDEIVRIGYEHSIEHINDFVEKNPWIIR